MKRILWLLGLLLSVFSVNGQMVQERLAKAVSQLQSDPSLKHAVLAISVVKTATGEKVFETNAQTGLAPASCQKIITSATAMELLRPDYRYKTELGYDGNISDSVLTGNLILIGSGDPTLGSWRYDSTRNDRQLAEWVAAIKQYGIRMINGSLVGYNGNWDPSPIAGGWTWEDMGNYYGAGNAALNWHENQYDLILRSGSAVGDKVTIVDTKPRLYNVTIQNELVAAEKGSGDNTNIYLPPFAQTGTVRGTIPAGEKAFVVSGSFPDPAMQMISGFEARLDSAHMKPMGFTISAEKEKPSARPIIVTYSPALDSINYWFMKKSINLYGEVLLRTMALEKSGTGTTEKGIRLVKDFWKDKGIDPSALHMIDGSGLSPQNRVTTDALVQVLQYARDRDWFRYYYDALPVYNQMKLKSGTIGGAKSFAGYHTSKDGTQYTVAMIVNNYEGPASEIVKKMFLVLDELK